MKSYISKNIKAIVFDLDGTLINSSLTVLDILNQIRRKYLNKKKTNLKKISKFLSIGGKILIKKTLQIKKEEEIISYLKIEKIHEIFSNNNIFSARDVYKMIYGDRYIIDYDRELLLEIILKMYKTTIKIIAV